jgi:hypothetical protein
MAVVRSLVAGWRTYIHGGSRGISRTPKSDQPRRRPAARYWLAGADDTLTPLRVIMAARQSVIGMARARLLLVLVYRHVQHYTACIRAHRASGVSSRA